MKLHVKTGDAVKIISGRDRDKQGKIIAVSPKEGKIIVEGCNMIKKHVKPQKMGDKGGIIDAEAPMYACKAMLICPKCNKPTRLAHATDKDGKKARLCKECGATF